MIKAYKLSLSRSDMSLLYDIPTEVIIYNIFPKVGVESTVLLTKVSKEFNKNKKNILSYLIKNDRFLLQFTKFYKIDLFRTLTQSSVSYKLFDNIYDYIKYDKNCVVLRNDGREVITAENAKQYQINNTYIIFRLLKTSINQKIKKSDQNADIRKKKSSVVVLNSMKKYFTNLYFARNPSKKFYTSFMDNMNVDWERCNVNLYNICENLNLMCADKECETLKNNLQHFDDTVVNRNGFHTSDTSLIIYKIFNNCFQPKKVKVYVSYVVFRYLNSVFEDNIFSKVIANEKFIKSSLNMLNDFEFATNYMYSEFIVTYFKEMILKEAAKYKDNIDKYQQAI